MTTSVLRVLDHLRAGGHEAIVVCPGPAPREYAGFPVHPVPALDYRGFRAAVPSRRLTKAVLDFQPDVLHAAAPFGIGAQALALARRQGIGSVAVFQTDVARYTRSYGLSLTHHAAWRWIRHVHGLADLTLAPSRASLDDLAAAGVERTMWWGRGVDSALYHPRWRTSTAGRELRERLSPHGEALIGYVGRLAPEKNVTELAPLARMRGARLVVVGDGPDRLALERTLHGTDAVLLGRMEGNELAAAYAALDVFVHTGTSETFGQTLQEAMASGLPVVAPAVGGPLDLVQAGETGYLVAPHDATALYGAVRTLVQDRGMRARMGEAGRRAILPRSWHALCEQLVDYYEGVARPLTVR
ncbi:glycosyltransferase family 4 protein [Ruania alba]|uniref:glycosyltransferase family 4 protein n=1 Tax=Ruania alba TaxID=648782 RepID=UPI001FE02420|nr:glycosyltransferase family 1 protein [Ruania alba]